MKRNVTILENYEDIPSDMSLREEDQFWKKHARSKELMDELERDDID